MKESKEEITNKLIDLLKKTYGDKFKETDNIYKEKNYYINQNVEIRIHSFGKSTFYNRNDNGCEIKISTTEYLSSARVRTLKNYDEKKILAAIDAINEQTQRYKVEYTRKATAHHDKYTAKQKELSIYNCFSPEGDIKSDKIIYPSKVNRSAENLYSLNLNTVALPIEKIVRIIELIEEKS